MERLPTYILAGGRSSRFGRDKARAQIGGEALLRLVAASLEPAASSVTVVADRAGKYRDLGFETIADLRPGLGPLGGLWAALSHHGPSGWLLCVSCDRVGVRVEWLQALLSARRAGARAVLFRGRIWQPLPGLYHSCFAPEVDAAIRAGRLTPWKLLEQTDSVALSMPSDWDDSVDINDLEELSRLYEPGGETCPGR